MATNRKKTRIKFLEKPEVEKLISYSRNARDRALFEVLFSTGLRIAECVSLPRAPFDNARDDTTLEMPIIGKGGWQRVVFFSPVSLVAVKKYLAERKDWEDSRLFPISTRQAERIVKKQAEWVGMKATPHTFRHSLATHLLKQGANIRIVQEMLGHRSLSSTMVYTGVTNKDLLEAHKKLVA